MLGPHFSRRCTGFLKGIRKQLRQPKIYVAMGLVALYFVFGVRLHMETGHTFKRPWVFHSYPGTKGRGINLSPPSRKNPSPSLAQQVLKNTVLVSVQDDAPKSRTSSIDNVGKPKCFKQSMVNNFSTCSACVNFLSIAKLGSRWSSSSTILDALHVVTTSLKLSQRCFTLHLYTDVKKNSEMERKLKLAGGDSVRLHIYPNDLPRNAYTGRNQWLELSRRKLDVISLHMKKYEQKVIWTDLDTIILTDLSCAYSKLQNFVISRDWPGEHFMRGPDNENVRVRHGYSVYGDFWMADKALIERVLGLEKRGMPAPSFDLQDYFAYMLNQCDGSLTDLRGYLIDDNSKPLCLGFDYSNGHHPYTRNINPMKVINGTLHCSVKRKGTLAYHRMASMSFIYPLFVRYIRNPKELFRSKEQMGWAREHGFTA